MRLMPFALSPGKTFSVNISFVIILIAEGSILMFQMLTFLSFVTTESSHFLICSNAEMVKSSFLTFHKFAWSNSLVNCYFSIRFSKILRAPSSCCQISIGGMLSLTSKAVVDVDLEGQWISDMSLFAHLLVFEDYCVNGVCSPHTEQQCSSF